MTGGVPDPPVSVSAGTLLLTWRLLSLRVSVGNAGRTSFLATSVGGDLNLATPNFTDTVWGEACNQSECLSAPVCQRTTRSWHIPLVRMRDDCTLHVLRVRQILILVIASICCHKQKLLMKIENETPTGNCT